MAQQPELLEIQTATLSTPAWPFEKYQFHLIGKVADTPAVTRYSVIRIMPSSDSMAKVSLDFHVLSALWMLKVGCQYDRILYKPQIPPKTTDNHWLSAKK